MSTTQVSRSPWTAYLALAGFSAGIAGRDVLWELWLSPGYRSAGATHISFTFIVCATIAVLSGALVALSGQAAEFLRKLSRIEVLSRAAALGALTAALYGTGFYLISSDVLGAGVFNVIDYGITPLATVLIGLAFFGAKLPKWFWSSAAFYVAGVILLLSGQDLEKGWWYGAVAMALPFITASTDGLSKWLLDEQGGGLTRPEMLVVRFLPAAIAVATYAVFVQGVPIAMPMPGATMIVALLGGFLPLWLLSSVLRDCGLEKLALWEFLIPVLAFTGTLQQHPENIGLPLAGAMLMLLVFGRALLAEIRREPDPAAARS